MGQTAKLTNQSSVFTLVDSIVMDFKTLAHYKSTKVTNDLTAVLRKVFFLSVLTLMISGFAILGVGFLIFALCIYIANAYPSWSLAGLLTISAAVSLVVALLILLTAFRKLRNLSPVKLKNDSSGDPENKPRCYEVF